MVTHCWATDILVAATLHFQSTQRQALYQEFNVMNNPLRTRLCQDPIRQADGFIAVPNGLGLGVELNDETVDLYRWVP